MRQERKTAPEQSATQYLSEPRSGARWCERVRRLAGGGASRTENAGKGASLAGLRMNGMVANEGFNRNASYPLYRERKRQ